MIALVDAEGRLDIRYHPMNDRGELMTGVCWLEDPRRAFRLYSSLPRP